MVAEGLRYSTELASVHFIDFVIPAGEVQTRHILFHLLVEDVCQFHRQVVGFLKLRIGFKYDISSLLLDYFLGGGVVTENCPVRNISGSIR